MSNVSYINVNGHLYPFDDPQLTEEVENIRIGADGKQYGSAGDALRSQLADINDGLETAQNNITQIYGEQDGEIENVSQAQGDITTLQNDASALATDISNTNSSLAPAFSESVTYAIGDYCIYDGTLYVAVAEHTGAWNAADFETAPIGGELETANAETAEAQEITQTVSGNKMGALIDTASGSIASFVPDSTVPTVRGLTVNVEPVQDLHGYDNPWPAGGGKNKIFFVPYSTDDYHPFSGVLQPSVDVANQTITLSCAASGQTALLYKHDFTAGQYTVSFNVTAYNKRTIVRCFDSSGNVLTDSDVSVTGGAWNSFYRGFYLASGTFTVPDTVDHFWLGIGVTNDVRGDTVTISKVMLESGSTASAWQPYSNICPISGWDEVEMQRTAINVWDEEMESGRISAIGQPSAKASWIRTKNYISVKPNTAYYRKSPNNIQLFWYDVEQNFLSYANWGTGAITSPSNAYYMKFHVDPAYGTTYNNDISINYPSTDTAYHSGKDNDTYQIQLGQTVYGCKIYATQGKMVVDRAEITLDGTQSVGLANWRVFSGSSAWLYGKSLTPNILNPATGGATVNILCDRLQSRNYTPVYEGTVGVTVTTTETWGLAVRVPVDGLTTGTLINSWLAENPLQVCYELATPITIDITPLEISVLTGQTNNIWADSGDVSVEYAADLKTYIDQKIAAAVAALS